MMAVAADLPVATDFIGSPLKASAKSVEKYLLTIGKFVYWVGFGMQMIFILEL